MVGRSSNEIKNYKHDILPVFGKGKEYDLAIWQAVIRQALIHDLIEKDIELYGVLKLTELGNNFVKTPKPFTLFKERDYSDNSQVVLNNTKDVVLDEQLYAVLKDLRKKIAKDKSVPPFVVFQEPSLQEMCSHYPITLEELKSIAGVGQGKATRFGKPFVEVIAKYVAENNIDRPMDVVVKSVANKSGLKIHIITNIDKKNSLEDIANSKKMSVKDLIGEIETIISSGTRVNLDYYIDEILDEECQEEIYDYFMEAETDSIEEAFKELDEEYEEEELRLMRIKFMSEMAN